MCQEELLMMSQRDRDRLRIIQQVSEGRLSQVDAAEQLGLTARHVRRLGKSLSFSGTRPYQRDNGKGIYRVYQCSSCQGCPLAAQCLRKDQRERRIYRDEYDAVRESRRAGTARLQTPAGQEAYRRRMAVAESPFGIIKNVMKLRQFLLRGIDKVRTEWRWAVTAFNLAKLVRFMKVLRAISARKGGVALE